MRSTRFGALKSLLATYYFENRGGKNNLEIERGLTLIPNTVSRRISNLLIAAGPITTLAISPWFNFDPINLIKVLFLTCTSFSAFGLLLPYFRDALKIVGKSTSFILGGFCLALFSSYFFSGANKSQQFWGVFGRNTGILTYVALTLVCFLTAILSSQIYYSKIVWSLVITLSIMSIYCLIQIANLDPISWSAFFPFGTLGNVNFLSGFMGIGLVSVFVLALSSEIENRTRFALSALFAIGIFVLIKSDSTQGVVALAVGISSYVLVKSWFVGRKVFLVSLFSYSIGFLTLVLGLFDKGPLRSLIYQFTVLYRADYMHAGVSMLMSHPLTGVGIDSYDDWYRIERGAISAFRTSLNRTANSAHNISIDIAAGGGFPLLITYLSLLLLIIFSVIKCARRGLFKDPFYLATTLSWLAYQVQASVSINQVGVGIWGWILGGTLIGYSKLEIGNPLRINNGKKSEKKIFESRRERRGGKSKPNTPPAIAIVGSSVMLTVGFILAFLPLKTDADFARASKAGSAELLMKLKDSPSVNSFMLSKSAVDSFQSNLPEIGKAINSKLTANFPRSIAGWFIIYENPTYSQSERSFAMNRIRQLDPYSSLCYSPDPVSEIRKVLDNLPSVEKFKLARGWGLVDQMPRNRMNNFSFSEYPEQLFNEKIRSFCGV